VSKVDDDGGAIRPLPLRCAVVLRHREPRGVPGVRADANLGSRGAVALRTAFITGATGLDDAEWGFTLFANDIFEIKSIVYEMRFDLVSAQYADFGEFYVGLQLPLDDLFRRIQL